MNFALTQIGQQMSHLTGVRAIMKDIIETLRTAQGREFINLSAGNPVILPEVEQLWRDCTLELMSSPEYGEVVCRYGSSQGYQPLIDAVVERFNQRYGPALAAALGGPLSDRNILITPGSQSLYFLAANALGGYTSSGQLKQIVLPLSPDYTGYGGVSLTPEALRAYKPRLDIDAAHHRFKYRPDFGQLEINETTGFVLFSRPSNPTGNVLSDQEVRKIAALAEPYNVPVFVDSAYSVPFPCLNFTEMNPIFGRNVVHCTSLSKAGLPGERVGIAIGEASLIQTLEAFLTNLCLHSSRYGQAIAALALRSGRLETISEQIIRPYYQHKFAVLETALDAAMPKQLPWFLHRGEGAIFAWLWLQDLPLTDWEFYQALKETGVIAVPGEAFFPGLQEDWRHTRECLRISLTASDTELETAMIRLAGVAEQVYQSAAVGVG